MKAIRYLVTGAAAVLAGTAAHAERYTISTFLEPNHLITVYGHTEFAENVREASDGEIDFEVFSGGALLPAAGTLEGVANGVAQVGVYVPAYAPSKLPILTAVGDLGFLKPDPMLMSFAYADFIFSESLGQEEWQKNGVVFGAGLGTPIYHFMCRGQVGTLAELKGKRVRTPGGGWSRFGDVIGLTPVNLPASEIYTGLERGAVDCISGDVTHLTSGANIGDIIESISMIDMGPPFTAAGIMYSAKFWQGLRDDQRRLLLDAGALAMVRLEMAFDRQEKAALEWAKSKGIALIEPDEALQKAYDDWVADGIGGLADYTREKLGVENPEAVFALFETYIEKWEKLLDGVDRTDEAALLALLKENAFDEVDVTKYGMQ